MKLLANLFRAFCVLLLLAGIGCGIAGYQKRQQVILTREKVVRAHKEMEALQFTDRVLAGQKEEEWHGLIRQEHRFQHSFEYLLLSAIVGGGLGLTGLLLPPLIVLVTRPFRPKRTFSTCDELISTEMQEQLRPGEQVLNTALVIRGFGTRWDTFCVALTNQRLLLFAVRQSLLAGLKLFKRWQEEFETKDILGTTTDQHWKGHDVIFQFKGREMLLRLNLAGKEVSGTRQFFEEVPQRFPSPSAGVVAEQRWREQLTKTSTSPK